MAQTLLYEKFYLEVVGKDGGLDVLVASKETPMGQFGKVHFFPTELDIKTGRPISTLVLDEEVWEEWWGDREMLPGFETAESAATQMVADNNRIYFGCPFCVHRTNDKGEYIKHVNDHTATVLDTLNAQGVAEWLEEKA